MPSSLESKTQTHLTSPVCNTGYRNPYNAALFAPLPPAISPTSPLANSDLREGTSHWLNKSKSCYTYFILPNGSDTDDGEINHNCNLKVEPVKLLLCITTHHWALGLYIQYICTNSWLILTTIITQNSLLNFYPLLKFPDKFKSSFKPELSIQLKKGCQMARSQDTRTKTEQSHNSASVFTSVWLNALPQSSNIL